MSKKVLIFYTSVGLGHKTIAENIGQRMQERGFIVRFEDILMVQEGWLVSSFKKFHALLHRRMPFVWSWLYHATNSPVFGFLLPVRVFIAGRNYWRTLQKIAEFQPDIVITTQTTASGVLAYLKERQLYTGTWAIAFSDYHLHRYWLYRGANYYLANTEEQKSEMIRLGVPGNSIYVCGVTLQTKKEVDVLAVRRKLRVNDGVKIILVGTGSMGVVINETALSELLALPSVHVVIGCGRNEELRKNLEQKYPLSNVTVLGFYQPMAELYAVADLFVTKPGGLSVAEALQCEIPIIITHLLPGQEELNYRYLLEKGAVMPGSFSVKAVAQELDSGRFRVSLRQNPHIRGLIDSPGLDKWIEIVG